METFRNLEKRDSLQEAEMNGAKVVTLSAEELLKALSEKKPGERLDLSRRFIHDVDLSGEDLSNIDFSCTRFERVNLENTNFDGDDVSRCFFVDCPMHGVKITNADASDASFRSLDLSDADFSGTNVYYAAFEFSNLEGIKTNEKTKWFGDAVPKEGAFICWKVGAENRVIQMLVPADAKRTCTTSEAGRAERVKVLSITNPERTIDYSWATAMVDDQFIYEVGKFKEPDNGFYENDWLDDSPGIHFFIDREMAIAFGTGNY